MRALLATSQACVSESFLARSLFASGSNAAPAGSGTAWAGASSDFLSFSSAASAPSSSSSSSTLRGWPRISKELIYFFAKSTNISALLKVTSCGQTRWTLRFESSRKITFALPVSTTFLKIPFHFCVWWLWRKYRHQVALFSHRSVRFTMSG